MVKQLAHDTQQNIKSLLNSGYSYTEIMKRIPEAKRSTISDYKNKFFKNRPENQSGRKSSLSDTTRSYIRRKLVSGEFRTAKDVHRYLDATGHTIGYSSCLKTLKSMDFQASIKKKKPFLKPIHMKKRLAQAKAHQYWTNNDWRRMVFSDETKVNVWGSDGVKYYWKRPDDKLQFHHLDLTVKGNNGSVMVWGCITYEGPGYACQITDGTMKKEDYIHILNTTLKDTLDWYGYNPEDIYFQQDNDPKHTAKATKQYLTSEGFNTDSTFSWPPQSPDLNPIEHVWHHLKLKLSSYETKAKGVHDLWDRIEEQWNTITKEQCQRYIDSMPARIQAVIKAKGGYTNY